METKLRELIEEWLRRSRKFRDIASEEFRFSNWQMGNVDSATAETYKKAALELQEVLDKHKD